MQTDSLASDGRANVPPDGVADVAEVIRVTADARHSFDRLYSTALIAAAQWELVATAIEVVEGAALERLSEREFAGLVREALSDLRPPR